MSVWTKQKFKNFVSLQRGFDLPRQDRVDGKYPVVASTSITAFHNEFKVKAPCVTTGRSGALGEVLYIDVDCWPLNTALWVKDFHKNNPRFVYYKLKTLGLEKFNAGAGVPTLNKNHLDTLEIEIPDLPTQTRIASVLSAYDDLIENNEKRIKALEEMAQLLYTEWFVKFKFPGHEKVKMIESGTEYGKIPDGWEVVPIIRLAEFMNGYPFKPKQLSKKGFPIVKIPELRSGILDKTPRNSGDGINKKYIIQTGDILFSWSATLLVNIWNSGEALLNQHLFKVTPKESIYNSYVFYALTLLVEKIRKHVVGATMQHLRKDTVESAQVLLPSMVVLTAYEMRASKMLHEMSLLNQKNQTLSKMRDLLIPQLVTGKREIKV